MKVNEEINEEKVVISDAYAKWFGSHLTVFGLTATDIANIQKQRKLNPEWFPESISGRKTYWAYVAWISARPKDEE